MFGYWVALSFGAPWRPFPRVAETSEDDDEFGWLQRNDFQFREVVQYSLRVGELREYAGGTAGLTGHTAGDALHVGLFCDVGFSVLCRLILAASLLTERVAGLD
jgi:hypothetical protein